MLGFSIPVLSGLFATNAARAAVPHIGSRYSMFKEAASSFSNHPLGFGILYAGGTTIGYHANPLNWRKDYKYVGRPQYVSRL